MFSSGEFHRRLCNEFCPGFETMSESVNPRIAGCKLMTSGARIVFFFFNSYSKPYNKQLNNLDRLVVTGKSQTSAYRNDLAIARLIRQGLGLRFSLTISLSVIKLLILDVLSVKIKRPH